MAVKSTEKNNPAQEKILPRASVVIIAYNDEAHIERAVKSAIDQTVREIEIICVDDGSTDNTYHLMLQAAAIDRRIKVITQLNNGAFAARFEGLQQVTGEYVLFLDSDDQLLPDAVRTACDSADELGADVLEFGVELTEDPDNPPTKELVCFFQNYLSQMDPLPGKTQGPDLVNACFAERIIPWNIWGKLYKTELLKKSLQCFQGERLWRRQDMLTTLMVLCHANHYARIPTKLYVYTLGSSKTTRSLKITSSEEVKNVGMEWRTLTIAQEWLNRIGYPKDQITDGMTAFAKDIFEGALHYLTIKVAPEKRGEYLHWLLQCSPEEEFTRLISESILREQNHFEQAEKDVCRLSENLAQQTEQNHQLEDQNRQLVKFRDAYNLISNSFFWKLTKPLRGLNDGLKHFSFYRLSIKGLKSIKNEVFSVALKNKRQNRTIKNLYTKRELEEQRKEIFPQTVKFSVVVPLYNTPKRFLCEMIQSVQAQTYANWELCLADGSDEVHADVEAICLEFAGKDERIRYKKLPTNLGISGNTNACLEMASGDYVALFDHDDLLHPAALHDVMKAICEQDADFIYTDESSFHKDPKDAFCPHFKPDFAPDSLRGLNYICHLTVFKMSLLEETGLFRPECDGSQDYDMILRLTEKAKKIVHIPEILYYWRAHSGSVASDVGVKPYVIQAAHRAISDHLDRIGLKGEVQDTVIPSVYRIKYEIIGTPLVSILIPNFEHKSELETCLNSVFEKSTYSNFEIVIIENNSKSDDIFAYYEMIEKKWSNVKVIRWNGPFNYSAINNFGALQANGDHLLLLNNDIEVISPDWIQEMLMFSQRTDVGAVGAMLYYPDNTIQHAGVIIGLGGVAGHSHKYFKRNDWGYMYRLNYTQDLTAVTAACLMIKKAVWDKLGGLDEKFQVAFNDVDFCMRIRQAGYLNVWTPFAELYHYESKSRGIEDTPEKRRRFEGEVIRFQKRWAKGLAAGDPYYNPNLTLDREDFSLKKQ